MINAIRWLKLAAILGAAISIPATRTCGEEGWRSLIAEKRYDKAADDLARSLVSERGDEAALALTEICRYITNWNPVLPHIKRLVTDVKLSPKQIDLVVNVCLFSKPAQESLLDDLVSRVEPLEMPRASLTTVSLAYATYGRFTKSRQYEAIRDSDWEQIVVRHKGLAMSERREILELFRSQPNDRNFEKLMVQVKCNLSLGETAEVVDELRLLQAMRPDSSEV